MTDDVLPIDAAYQEETVDVDAAVQLALAQATLLDAIASSKLDTVEQRVAWLLNHFAETRNSDIRLAIEYWERFDDRFDRASFAPESLYGLTRIPTLTRARARIQNQLRLFQATEEVRARRGTLSAEERLKPKSGDQPAYPSITAFIDESGKEGPFLITGGLWALSPYAESVLAKEIRLWLGMAGLKELHFVRINAGNLRHHVDFVHFLKERFATFSFKFIAMPRAGSGAVSSSLSKLFYHLLSRGLEHEHATGRATLPRTLSVWKDAEEENKDTLAIADLHDQLSNAAIGRFGGKLQLGTFATVKSEDNPLIQVCDLLLGSVNRTLNGSGTDGDHPKDQFARLIVDTFGLNPEATETVEDVACRLRL